MSAKQRWQDRLRCRAGLSVSHHGRGIALLCLLAALAPGLPAVAADPSAGEEPRSGHTGMLRIEDAVAIAVTANPGVAGLESRAAALGTVPSQVGSLEDPILALNALNLPTDTFDLDQEAMTQIQVTLTQALPYPGKLGLAKKAAESEAVAADALVAERRLSLGADVRVMWWRLFALDRSLDILAQNLGFLRDFVEIARTKYEVGNGLQQDVLLAQLELSHLLNRRLSILATRNAVAAKLNAKLDRPPEQSLRLPAEPPNKRLPARPANEALTRQAVEARPLLAAQRHGTDAARARLDLARKAYFPDFKLGAGYGFRQADDRITGRDLPDFFSVMFSFNLPIRSGTRQDLSVDQRAAELSEQRFSFHDARRQVEASITGSHAEYDAAREQVRLFGTAIVPQAQQTVSSMLAGYRVNEVDFLNVINAQLALFEAQISYWNALSRAKQALARLAAAVGEESLYE